MTRINKYLSMCGVTSRRGAEQMVKQGRVTVNDITVEPPGVLIDEEKDIVKVDGTNVSPAGKRIYIILNKPKNVITTLHDPFRRKTIAFYVRKLDIRIYPIGRLDYDTDGVLLMTNDGELAYRLAHPKYEVKKVYIAIVNGPFTYEDIQKIENGIRLQDGHIARGKPEILKSRINESMIRITLTEGHKREVKQIFKATGHPVKKLTRIEFAGLRVDNMKPGRWRFISQAEVQVLKELVGL